MTVQETRVELPRTPESIGLARRIVADVAQALPEAVAADATLLTSELVTNALRYGGPRIELTTALADRALTVAVEDDGDGLPIPSNDDLPADSVTGRGLRMVSQLAAEWGVRTTGGIPGKTVWFRVIAEPES